MRHLTFEVTEDEWTDGGACWAVSCPQIAGFVAQGASIDEALEDAISLLRELKFEPDWLDAYRDAVSNGSRVEVVALTGGTFLPT